MKRTGKRKHHSTRLRSRAVRPYRNSTVTFDEWDAGVAYGDCLRVSDSGFGRGRKPVINVTWDDAQRYVAWLSKMTGKPYRLLSEAEWEYAARAGTQTAYSWGDKIGKGNAHCIGCGSQWDRRQAAPVGSFARNPFGLYDMHGNVWEWVEDWRNDSYNGAPTDGSAWTSGDCNHRMVRGGGWHFFPQHLRSAPQRGHRRRPGRELGHPYRADAYPLSLYIHRADVSFWVRRRRLTRGAECRLRVNALSRCATAR
jgi:formylglycine-generating enzyme required for sulfatase activity